MKILIAEDNAISQELLKKILITRGHEVVVAGDGRVAWDLLCQGLNPDLAILDIMMPAMSGLELKQCLVRDGFDIPTIMITAHRDACLHEHENAGLVAFLLKPLQDSILFAAIDRAIGISRNGG